MASEEIIKVLQYLGQQIGVTIDWTNQNVLPFAEQIAEKVVKWEVATSIAWIGVGFVLLLIWAFLGIAVKKIDDEMVIFLYFLILVIFFLTFLGVTGQQVFDIIECNTFPEKTIYDWAVQILQQRR